MWESVEYFLTSFDSALNTMIIDEMYGEFCDYQTLSDEDIGQNAWDEAKLLMGQVMMRKLSMTE